MESKTFRRSAIALAVAGAFAIGVTTADKVSMHTANAAVSPPTVSTPADLGAGQRRAGRGTSGLQRTGREIRARGGQHQRHQRRPQSVRQRR